MKKTLLFITCFLSIIVTLNGQGISYYGVRDSQYDYNPYYKSDAIMENNNPGMYSGRKSGYSVRLVLSGYDDIVLELTSTENINNDVYLLFAGGIIKPMRRYSNNIYYYVFDNFIELDAIVLVNDKNIFVDKNLKAQLQNDYAYMAGVVNNRYYKDRYYKDYNFQYKR